jgi:hypothetical protein
MSNFILRGLAGLAVAAAIMSPIGTASAFDQEYCELVGGALCSAYHVEGSPSWKSCVWAYMEQNCPSGATSDMASFDWIAKEPE